MLWIRNNYGWWRGAEGLWVALPGMHSQKQFKEPSDVGIILHDQIRSKWEKSLSGILERWTGLVLQIIQREAGEWWVNSR